MNKVSRNGTVIGIIILFIGTSFVPIINADIEKYKPTNERLFSKLDRLITNLYFKELTNDKLYFDSYDKNICFLNNGPVDSLDAISQENNYNMERNPGMIHSFLVSITDYYVEKALTNSNNLPDRFDLRNVNAISYVTSVKNQRGSTCWLFPPIAAIESNLLISNTWNTLEYSREPDLSEYHMDWWNGFNDYFNQDLGSQINKGIPVHAGGSELMAVAYLTRGEGALYHVNVNDDWYIKTPSRFSDNYDYFYVRDIVRYDAGHELEMIDDIKKTIMQHGAISTIINIGFLWKNIFYQPSNDSQPSNHAVSLIGWDDTKVTPANHPGAWLCKNSWGPNVGIDGYFWISYYDKWCCKAHPFQFGDWISMWNGGAYSYQNVQPNDYYHIYYHDYHGWVDTLVNISEAFNVFQAMDNEKLTSVSFFTACDNVSFTVKIFDSFLNDHLEDELATLNGTIQKEGFHTIDLESMVKLDKGDDFFVYLYLSSGGHPIDMTPISPEDVPDYVYTYESSSNPNESYYLTGEEWIDLHYFEESANFCIKALTKSLGVGDLESFDQINLKRIHPNSLINVSFSLLNVGSNLTSLDWEICSVPSWGKWTVYPMNGSDLQAGDTIEVNVSIKISENRSSTYSGEITVVNLDDETDIVHIPVSISTIKNYRHEWNSEGTYNVRVRAKDEHGVQSDLSDPLVVSMPKNKADNFKSLFLRAIQNYPQMFSILKLIFGL